MRDTLALYPLVCEILNPVLTRRCREHELNHARYDKNGNLLTFTDRNNQVTTFQYDHLNRKTFAGFGVAAGNPPTYQSTINYTYDAGNRLTQAADSVAG